VLFDPDDLVVGHSHLPEVAEQPLSQGMKDPEPPVRKQVACRSVQDEHETALVDACSIFDAHVDEADGGVAVQRLEQLADVVVDACRHDA